MMANRQGRWDWELGISKESVVYAAEFRGWGSLIRAR
jgi:hypothetical protein